MKSSIDSLLTQCENLRFSKPLEAYALIRRAAKKAERSKDLLGLALANEIIAALERVLGDIPTANDAAQSALLFFRVKKMIGKEANCLLLIGQITYDLGNVEKSFRYYQDAERLVRNSAEDAVILARAYGLQGNVKLTMGKPAEAFKYLIKSLEVCEQFDLKLERGNSLQGLASFYLLEEDYDKSLSYSNKALPIFKAFNDKYRQCFNLNSLGITHLRKHEPTKALECFIKAVKLANHLGIIYIRVWSLSNLIEGYIQEKHFAKATRYINKLLLLRNSKMDVVSQATIFSAAGSFYMALNKPDLAIKNLQTAIDMFSAAQYGRLQMLEKLLEIYIQINDVDNTIKTLKVYLSLKDEIFSIENQREINQLEESREIQRKAIVDDQLEKYSQHRFEKDELVQSIKQKFNKNKNSKTTIETIQDQARQIADSFDHELYISMTYNDFLTRLSKRFPDLSSTELKIATLLRLNMSSKRIASLLSISIRTVEYHRTNIRRKVKLKAKDNIQLFLMKI